MINRHKLYRDTAEILKRFNLTFDPRTLVKQLSVANQQVVEILKALSLNPRVLILDEPTSSLTGVEKEILFKTLQELKKTGIAIIYISHHLSEVFEIADRITVLR